MLQYPIAYLALLVFVPFTIVAYQRLNGAAATSLVVLSGMLFLPMGVALDLPAMPPMGRDYITYLAALAAAILFHRNQIIATRPGSGPELLLVAVFFANIATALMNSNPMMDEGRLEDGLGPYWVIVRTSEDCLELAIPFFVGRAMFRTVEDVLTLFKYMLFTGLVYAGLIFIEFVMSIPFRVWQFSFLLYDIPIRPNFRWGFMRPVVFMGGLAASCHMAMVAIAAGAFCKARIRLGWLRPGLVRGLVLTGLVLTLTVAGNVYGWAYTVLFKFLRARVVALAAMGLTTFVLIYPMLRMSDMFPYEVLVDFAAQYEPERARSLEGRFLEEEHVMSQIDGRLWVGWGNIQRTPGAETFGQGEVGLDGWWVIQLGSRGLIGVMLFYLVLAIPVFRAWSRGRSGRTNLFVLLTAAIMAMISLRMADLIINGWWNSLPVFLAGALYGLSSRERPDSIAKEVKAPVLEPHSTSRQSPHSLPRLGDRR